MISRRAFLAGVAAAAPIAFAACAAGSGGASRKPASPATQPTLGPEPTSTTPFTTATPTAPETTLPVAPATAPSTTVAAATTNVAATGGPATYLDHGVATTDMVALTFHLSGDPKVVTNLADLLHERGVTVTAFAVGTWITAHPELTTRLVADGHELGNHTEHHLEMGQLTRQQISDEIVQCGHALVPFIGSIGRWFRPSATVVPGQVILDEAGRAGYPVSVGYDIDSVDNKDPGSSAIVANVNPNLHPGAIVSLHFGHPGTITALPHILDELAARNLRPVTLGMLLG